MNDKSSPIQMRILLKRMRNNNYVVNETPKKSKDLTIRDMLKITRKNSLNEQVVDDNNSPNKKTVYDQNREEQNFRNYFDDLNVDIKFIDLEIFNNIVFWGGTIDGIIQFIYKVTPDERTSGVEFNYLEDFSPDNPDNDLIIKRVESYYDTFYKYWRDNMLQ